MKRLPKTLSLWRGLPLDEDVHKNLTRLTGDTRARIFYGLYDTAQPLPHAATVLVGRDIVGWVLQIGHENDTTDTIGDVILETMETFLPVNDHAELVRDFIENSVGRMCLLNQTVGTLRERDSLSGDSKSIYTDKRTTWHRWACELLTRRLGMIEVHNNELLRSKALAKPGSFRTRVLVPSEKKWDWEDVTLDTARFRAEQELKSPAFWNLPERRRTLYSHNVGFTASSLSDTLPPENHGVDPSFLEGLTELTATYNHAVAGVVEFRAWRHKSDRRWTFDLDMTQSNRKDHRSYNIVSGDLVLQLAGLAVAHASLPGSDTAVDNLNVSEAAFQARVDKTHERRRELDFVCEALGLQRPQPTVQEAQP